MASKNEEKNIDKIPSQVMSTEKLDSDFTRKPRDEFYVGKWLLFVDTEKKDASGLTEQDKAWAKVVPLLKQRGSKIIRVASSTAASSSSSRSTRGSMGYISCYTGNFNEVRDVKRAASVIKTATNYKGNMFYKADVDSKLKKTSSRGSVDISLYKLGEDGQLFTREFGNPWFEVKRARKLSDINSERIEQMREESKMIPSGNSSGAGGSSNNVAEIGLVPSRVTLGEFLDSGYVRNPKNKADVGKWMLFLDAVERDEDNWGLTDLDEAWAKVVELTKQPEERNLVRVSCSTRSSQRIQWRFNSNKRDPNLGVIKCFTKDFTKISVVRETAQSIKNATGYPNRMYYKIELDPNLKGYSAGGYVDESIYMYNGEELFAKSDSGDWVPLNTARNLQNVAPARVKGIRQEIREFQRQDSGEASSSGEEDDPY